MTVYIFEQQRQNGSKALETVHWFLADGSGSLQRPCCLNSSVEKFCKASFFVDIIQCNRTAEKLSFREVTTYGSFTNDLFCVVPVHFKSLSWDHLAISILHSSCTLNISTLRRHILLCSDKEIRWEQAVKKNQKNDP